LKKVALQTTMLLLLLLLLLKRLVTTSSVPCATFCITFVNRQRPLHRDAVGSGLVWKHRQCRIPIPTGSQPIVETIID
jgi:hypothetical protein